jgi:hypothetical protein
VSALAVMLIAMGIADIGRRLVDRAWVSVLAAPLVVLGCGALAALWQLGNSRGGRRWLGVVMRTRRADG